jgi:hypothetical protein
MLRVKSFQMASYGLANLAHLVEWSKLTMALFENGTIHRELPLSTCSSVQGEGRDAVQCIHFHEYLRSIKTVPCLFCFVPSLSHPETYQRTGKLDTISILSNVAMLLRVPICHSQRQPSLSTIYECVEGKLAANHQIQEYHPPLLVGAPRSDDAIALDGETL